MLPYHKYPIPRGEPLIRIIGEPPVFGRKESYDNKSPFGFALDELAKYIAEGKGARHTFREYFEKIIQPGPAYRPISFTLAERCELNFTELA
jgi:hypothetical protein